MALKEKLLKGLEDLTSLEVATLTNQNNADLNMSGDSAGIFTDIKNNLNQTKLVAYSRFELDGDSVNYINSEASYADLVEGHKELVLAAQDARTAFFETILAAIQTGINELK